MNALQTSLSLWSGRLTTNGTICSVVGGYLAFSLRVGPADIDVDSHGYRASSSKSAGVCYNLQGKLSCCAVINCNGNRLGNSTGCPRRTAATMMLTTIPVVSTHNRLMTTPGRFPFQKVMAEVQSAAVQGGAAGSALAAAAVAGRAATRVAVRVVARRGR